MRAVHLEVAHSLDTNSCVMAVRRSQARRGKSVRLFSDNGSKFVSAEWELGEALAELDQKPIDDERDAWERGISRSDVPLPSIHRWGYFGQFGVKFLDTRALGLRPR